MDYEHHKFALQTKFKPTGDQPKAIKDLVAGMKKDKSMQTLLGVTGSGKTFTMANVIANINKPTLVIAHNKTLAAQLYEEFKELFPNNRVEYFISYYDYYQPESYLPAKDQYIEKDSAINPRIEQMRLAATASLKSRSDVIVVASVSCIYGLGNPEHFLNLGIDLKIGDTLSRKEFIKKLIGISFERNDVELVWGRFRVKGDTVDLIPGYANNIIRVEFFGDEIERISEIDRNTGQVLEKMNYFYVYPARHFVIPEEDFDAAIQDIRKQLQEDLQGITDPLINHRLKQRTSYDMEMMKETGTCKGIENYSRHFDKRGPGEPAFCLLDYFPKGEFLIIIDESHRTIPQIHGMYNGDRARKQNLIEYGFRLTSAYDNRPLQFNEFEKYMQTNDVVFVSATPGDYEYENSKQVVEQIIRPTGLVDPQVEVRPISSNDKASTISNVVLIHGVNEKDREKVAKGEVPQNKRHWLSWIKEELEKKRIKAVTPLMPKNWNPKYEEWKKEFEKIDIDDNSILVGHSGGGGFLLRWLGENKRRVKKLILVAPAIIHGEEKSVFDDLLKFNIDKNVLENVEEIRMFVSNDERESIRKSCEIISKELDIPLTEFKGRGHFLEKQMGTKEFPELLSEIITSKEGYSGQVVDVKIEIDKAIAKGHRVLLTTLTKKLAEELTDYLASCNIKTRYLHSEVDTLERTEILRQLRLGEFDVLVGINLLREGIDIPEVGFVGILDADKEGFLRDEKSLVQIIGRAARNSDARVVMYADNVTGSIKLALSETERRRELQLAYNKKHYITPKTVIKPIKEKQVDLKDTKHIPKSDIPNLLIELEADMKTAAENLNFEEAIALREKIGRLKERLS